MKKIYNIKIEPLTAVHIGTGETLTPLDYNIHNMTLKNGGKKSIYAKFSSDEIIARLIGAKDEKALREFERASGFGDIKELQKFFHNNFTLDDSEYLCDVTKEFLKIYDDMDNALEVLQMYRPAGKQTPVIPGSSLKGAIRTALLNDIIDSSDENFNVKNAREIEKKLFEFQNEKTDPLRVLAISDVSFESRNCPFVGVVKNVGLNKFSGELVPKKMQMLAEMVFGNLLGRQTSSITQFLLDVDLQNSVVVSEDPKKNFSMKTKFDITTIIDSCNNFFANTFDEEYARFFSKCEEKTDVIVQLKKQIDEIYESENSFPLRLGHWSQVEFVTLDKIRNPSKRGKPQKYGTTRTLLDYDGNFVPMGWCKCTVMDSF